MRKQANIGTELSEENLVEVHGGGLWPYPPGHSLPQVGARVVIAVGKAVGSAAKSVWDTITGWF